MLKNLVDNDQFIVEYIENEELLISSNNYFYAISIINLKNFIFPIFIFQCIQLNTLLVAVKSDLNNQ